MVIPEMAFGLMWPSPLVFHLVMVLLAAPALFVAGRPTLRAGFRAAWHLSPTMDTLIALGTSASFVTGVAVGGAHVVVSTYRDNVLIDASEPAALELRGAFATPYYADEIEIRGDTIYAASTARGLQLYAIDGAEAKAPLGRVAIAWDAPYRRLTRNPFAQDLMRQAVRIGFVVVGAVLALEVLDATTVVAAVAGIAGLAGLAVSFAFRDLAENYIASVLLSLRQPFLADEHVVIEGHEGRVVRLTSRATILIDLDGNHVRIPNAAVFKGTILNYSRNPLRRFGFVVGVATDADVGEALSLGVETLERMPGVVADPAPQAWVEVLGDWNVGLRFTAWIDQRETGWFKARGEAMRLVKQAFDAGGIVMPEPALSVRAPTAGTREPVAVEQPAAASPPIEPES